MNNGPKDPAAPQVVKIAITICARGIVPVQTEPAIEPMIPCAFAIALGTILLAGLWTPVSGSLVAVLGIWNSISRPGDPWCCIFLATIGTDRRPVLQHASLALLAQ